MTADDSDAHGGDEEFYESLDRILSSSCSSTSASDDDSATGDRRRRRGGFSSSSSLLLPSSLDVWTSEPASVAERRRRLLQCLGLAGDPALSHLRSVAHSPADAAGEVETRRSAQCKDLFPRRRDHPSGTGAGAVAVRSRSEGSVDPGFVNINGGKTKPQHQHQRSIQFPVSSKPPLGARSRASSMGALDVVPDAGAGGDVRDDSEDSCSDPRCLIKNLDTGREFVVNEFREDGALNKLREVATGRQLTMEEFEMCVGRSPIVQELMRRQSVDESANSGDSCEADDVARTGAGSNGGTRPKKRGGWLRSIRNVAGTMVGGGYRDRKSSDEKDTSAEKGGGRSSSATDDSQDGGWQHGFERIKVRQYGKSHKELTGMYLSQEIQAHKGPIWCIKFSLDGRYLASAGEDCVIHVWEVLETDRRAEFLNEKASDENGVCNPFVVAFTNGSPEPSVALACAERSHWEKKRRSKIPGSRKSVSSDPLMVPEHVFTLSERPVCSFKGHLNDVLDLSWSKSKYLLSSSMDKTVRLWHMSSNSCLKTFSHSDYVTCIQFNPVDDRYFISGSLDEKVRIWNIPDRQIVDWTDLHEMVTSASYTPDGKGALVGSHKGGCHLYDTSENKLLQRRQVDLENKKSRHKKITGFQFAPGSSSKVLITSADSRIRVVDGEEQVHKFKGFRNTSSQISACFTANGKYVICASEDSNVYVWRYDDDSRPNRSKGATVTQYYEHFHCQGVTVAVPWPNTAMGEILRTNSNKQQQKDGELERDLQLMSEINSNLLSPPLTHQCLDFQPNSVLNPCSNRFSDRVSATWPEELMTTSKQSPRSGNSDVCNGGVGAPSKSAWGLVIVTADHDGGIRTFQNFGFPIRV